MRLTKYTIADISCKTDIPYSRILELSVTSKQGSHGKLTIRLEVSDDMTNQGTDRYRDSEISLSMITGKKIFCGICQQIRLINESGYKLLEVTAYSKSYEMDREKKNKKL